MDIGQIRKTILHTNLAGKVINEKSLVKKLINICPQIKNYNYLCSY